MGEQAQRGADAKLCKLEAQFNAADERWAAASAKTAELDEEIERLTSKRDKAERKEAKKADATARAFDLVMDTRAKSLHGLLVKVRVRDRWRLDDEQSEIGILKSLVRDIKAMAGEV